jgi:hypothetical protein
MKVIIMINSKIKTWILNKIMQSILCHPVQILILRDSLALQLSKQVKQLYLQKTTLNIKVLDNSSLMLRINNYK